MISKQGWIKVQTQSHGKGHRRYCRTDWDKAILFISTKVDGGIRDWIKLLPCVEIKESEQLNNNVIEIKFDNKVFLLQTETKADYDEWILTLKRTAYSRIGGGIFGQSLEETYRYSTDRSSPVPLIVRHCCEYLLKNGSTFVGLFRIPGKQSSIRELRNLYDRGISIDLNASYSPATISSLLKNYLQSLPEPIVPPDAFGEFLEIGSHLKYNRPDDFESLRKLLRNRLSPLNYALLSYLCLFLKKLTEFQQETKMDTENLALTFGNNLIRSSENLDLNMIKGHSYNLLPLIKGLINQSHFLFSDHSTSFQDSTDQHNQSLAKSSGFSSSSSLLSSHEETFSTQARSSSLPLIVLKTSCSSDSVDVTDESFSDIHDAEINLHSDFLLDEQSFTTCFDEELTSYQEDETIRDDFLNFKVNEPVYKDPILLNDTTVYETPSEYPTVTHLSSPIQNLSAKKTLVNRVGKSLQSFKSSMTKAFHGNLNSLENNSSQKEASSDSLSHSEKNIQRQIEQLTILLDQKETFLDHLRKVSRDQYKKYRHEKVQLNEIIERLQFENSQLKLRQRAMTTDV